MSSGDISARTRFYRLGSFAYRRKWWVIAAWIVTMGVLGPQLGVMQDRMSNGGFEVKGSQSDRVKNIIENDFSGQYNLSDLLVMHSDSMQASDADFRSTFEGIKQELSTAPGVAAISDPYQSPEQSISPDGTTLTARVGLTDDQDQALAHADVLDEAVAKGAGDSDITALLTGAAPFYRDFSQTTTHDLERAEKIAFPITLIILLIAFGSLIAAGMPLIMAILALAVSFGFISIIAANWTVSLFTQNIASMIGLGVGIDYSLFMVTRFRERLRAGSTVEKAISEAMATSGKAVFVSALTVAVSLSGTLLVNLQAFRSMGLGAMIAVAVAGAAALTLLPALLSAVGPKVNSLRIGRRRDKDSAMWHRWSMIVMRRPWVALGAAVLILGFIAYPALDLKVGSSGVAILPKDSGVRRAAELTADAFGEGQIAPIQVVVKNPDGVLADGFSDVYAIAQAIATNDEVVRVDSVATLAPDADEATAFAVAGSPEAQPFVSSIVTDGGNTTLLSVVTRHGAQSEEADGLVRDLRADFPNTTQGGSTVLVGGDPGLELDINNELSGKLPYIIGLVLLLSFLILLVFLRSLLLPLKAVLLNLGSVLAAYGMLVLVFQKGFGEGLLGFEAQGHIDPFLPVFMFCILFGLSMDYEVFMLSRIREEYQRSHDNTEAVGWGLEHTAGIITSAAAIMVTVFGGFAAATLIPIKAMGFGLAVAVFLDATLIRAVMVPATMRLMGDWNWWLPGWLDRILPKVSLEEAPPLVEPLPAEG
jgi:RND superfamily putative drug exporter